ncbi:hypothetical protein C8R48DRAFT_181527 [Suillus tomentosus]|nr:hypothetical protein C8R48DRAFT_181527 [Suillus tomentosus]
MAESQSTTLDVTRIGTGTGTGLTFKTRDPCARAGISCDFVYQFIYHHRPCGSCRGPVLVTLGLKAIALHREALTLLPVGHTDRSGSLNSLAAPLSSRFCR